MYRWNTPLPLWQVHAQQGFLKGTAQRRASGAEPSRRHRAKKVLRALQTNLTDERRTEEIRSKERFGKNTRDVKVQLKVQDTNEVTLRSL